MKNVVTLLGVLVIATGCHTQTTSTLARPQDYTYTTNNGTITVVSYRGTSRDVTIPDTLGTLLVTSIDCSAFSCCTNLSSITIPDSVTSIVDLTFFFCFELRLYSCTNLNMITVNAMNPEYSSMNGVLFNKSSNCSGSRPERAAT